MKKLLALILAAVMVFALCACGSTAPAPAPAAPAAPEAEASDDAPVEAVTITMSNWLEAEEATAGIFKEMLDDFMAENPDIKVESQAIPFSNYKDQVLIAATQSDETNIIVSILAKKMGAAHTIARHIRKEYLNEKTHLQKYVRGLWF